MSDDNTRRHWHGTAGDRHEQLNVWMNGGAKAPSSRAPWAMMPGTESPSGRKDSTTSNNSNSNTSPNIPSLGERRRSSASSGGGLFANLQSQKRDSTSPDMATRRASWNEQAAKGGPFSKWWDGYMRGNK